MESLYFLIPLFFVLILIFPLNISLKLCLDIHKKKGYVSIFLWKLRIILIKVVMRDDKLFIITKKKKKEIELSLSFKQIYFIDYIVENLKDKTRVKKLSINSRIGTKDAYSTAMLCGYVVSIFKWFFAYLKNQKPTASMQINVMPAYNRPVFVICMYLNLTTTLFDLIYSLIISLFSLRSKVYERAKRKSEFS